MAHVTPAQAMTLAETDAANHWNGLAPPVHNCGAPNDTFIYTDEADALIQGWRNRGQFVHTGAAFDRRASYSSGEPKVDLKLAPAGAADVVPSSFNFHIRFQPRPKQVTELTEKQRIAQRRAECERIVNQLRHKEGKKDYLKLSWIDEGTTTG